MIKKFYPDIIKIVTLLLIILQTLFPPRLDGNELVYQFFLSGNGYRYDFFPILLVEQLILQYIITAAMALLVYYLLRWYYNRHSSEDNIRQSNLTSFLLVFLLASCTLLFVGSTAVKQRNSLAKAYDMENSVDDVRSSVDELKSEISDAQSEIEDLASRIEDLDSRTNYLQFRY